MKPYLFSLLLISLVFCIPLFANQKLPLNNNKKSTLIRKNYSSLPAPVGPYSIAVQHGNTLYLSGITAFNTTAQNKGIVEQAEAIFDQMKQIIKQEGVGMENLIKVTIYVTSMDDIASLRKLLSEQYKGANPVSSLIQVAGLAMPELNIEVEAIFAIPM